MWVLGTSKLLRTIGIKNSQFKEVCKYIRFHTDKIETRNLLFFHKINGGYENTYSAQIMWDSYSEEQSLTAGVETPRLDAIY